MKPLVIYHGQCMDGAAAALAAWLRFGEEAEYRPASYGDPAPTDDEVRGRDVFILDFSYPRAELDRMAHVVKYGQDYDGDFVLLDHHRTAQADLTDLPFCTFNINKSGAVLAWEHFHNPVSVGHVFDVPELFRYVQDRDLWRWELPHSREVSAALAASGALVDFRKLIPIYQGWDGASDYYPQSKDRLISDGATILRAER